LGSEYLVIMTIRENRIAHLSLHQYSLFKISNELFTPIFTEDKFKFKEVIEKQYGSSISKFRTSVISPLSQNLGSYDGSNI
jgi:hypothetical protein